MTTCANCNTPLSGWYFEAHGRAYCGPCWQVHVRQYFEHKEGIMIDERFTTVGIGTGEESHGGPPPFKATGEAQDAKVAPRVTLLPIHLTAFDLAQAMGILERAVTVARDAASLSGTYERDAQVMAAEACRSDLLMLLGKVERALRSIGLAVVEGGAKK